MSLKKLPAAEDKGFQCSAACPAPGSEERLLRVCRKDADCPAHPNGIAGGCANLQMIEPETLPPHQSPLHASRSPQTFSQHTASALADDPLEAARAHVAWRREQLTPRP